MYGTTIGVLEGSGHVPTGILTVTVDAAGEVGAGDITSGVLIDEKAMISVMLGTPGVMTDNGLVLLKAIGVLLEVLGVLLGTTSELLGIFGVLLGTSDVLPGTSDVLLGTSGVLLGASDVLLDTGDVIVQVVVIGYVVIIVVAGQLVMVSAQLVTVTSCVTRTVLVTTCPSIPRSCRINASRASRPLW